MSQEGINILGHELENARSLVDQLSSGDENPEESTLEILLGDGFTDKQEGEIDEFMTRFESLASFYENHVLREDNYDDDLTLPEEDTYISPECAEGCDNSCNHPEEFLENIGEEIKEYDLPEDVEANVEMLTQIPGDFLARQRDENDSVYVEDLLQPFEAYEKKMDDSINIENNLGEEELEVDRGFRPAFWTWAKNLYEHGEEHYNVKVGEVDGSVEIDIVNGKSDYNSNSDGSGLRIARNLCEEYDVNLEIEENEEIYRGVFSF